MKRLAWLPLLAASVFAFAQDVGQTIDFTHRAAPTRIVLEALSKQTGVPLVVAGVAAQEIVLIKVKNAVLNDVLKKIAEVSSCEWKVEGEGFRLQPAPGVRNAEARKEREARIAALRKQIAERVKALTTQENTQSKDQLTTSIAGMMGGTDSASRAVTQLLSQIDVSALADLERGQRVVFSTAPTRMQRPLGRNAQSVIAELVRKHNAEASQTREAMGNAAMSEEEKAALDFARQFMGQRDQLIRATPAKMLLVGRRESLIDALGVQIVLYDAIGKVVFSADDNLMMDMQGMLGLAAAARGEDPDPEKEKPDPDPTPIEFSAITKELSQMFSGMGMGSSPFSKPMSRELRQALLRPDLHDPLAFTATEILIAISDARKTQLVASVPDNLAGMESLIGNTKPTIGQAVQQYFEGDVLTAETKDGWLTVRPAKPDANRRGRVDRPSLARIVAAGDKKGVPSLDDLANYALANPPAMETPAAMVHLMYFAPNVMNQGFGGAQDWDMLRFYATLSPGQRQSLQSGGRITIPAMTLPQREIVASMAFGTSAQLRIGAKPKDEGLGFMEMMRAFMPAPTNDYREEPTELMPTGLPAAGVLTLGGRKAPIAVLAGDPNMGQGIGLEDSGLLRGALGVDELSLFEYFRQDPNFSAVASMMPQLGNVRVGERAIYDFTFNLGPNVYMDRSLNDDAYDASSEPVSMDNLPQGFKDQIAKRVEAFKKSPLPFGMGMGQRAVPPPK